MNPKKARPTARQRRNRVTRSAALQRSTSERQSPTALARSGLIETSIPAIAKATPLSKRDVDVHSAVHEHSFARDWNSPVPTGTYDDANCTKVKCNADITPVFSSDQIFAPFESICAVEVDECRPSTPLGQSELVKTESSESERPYTSQVGSPFSSQLGLPTSPPPGHSPALSVISDAGEQQQLLSHIDDEHARHQDDLAQSLQSLAVDESNYELQEEIMKALVSTKGNGGQVQEFLPRGQLCRLINKDSVIGELSKVLSNTHSQAKIEIYAEAVCSETKVKRHDKEKIKSFRKIFALLVMADKTESISLFLEEDVSDIDLPLAKKEGSHMFYRRDEEGSRKTPLRCFRNWKPFTLRHFEKNQWMMLAPFFAPDKDGYVKHYLLRDEHILPFVASSDAEDHLSEIHGGYGKVFMVRIHSDHHNFRDNQLYKRGFAIKQLFYHDQAAFEQEVRILKAFSGARSHKHVVSLLGTYEHLEKYHFIFYRAEGDLFRYWAEINPRPEFRYGTVAWVMKQCCGMADGLSRLHRHMTSTLSQAEPNTVQIQRSTNQKRVKFDQNISDSTDRTKYGRHGDINPGNILWYGHNSKGEELRQGTLKIADFGEAELNTLRSRTGPRSVAGTLTYQPPECDLQPRIIRQSYDIWCLGCVYLEFVAWMLGGERLREEFRNKRLAPDALQNNLKTDTFFQIVKNPETDALEIMIKPAVTEFVDELHKHTNCSGIFHDMLDMIQHNMLVEDSIDRMSCNDVLKCLEGMRKKCSQDRTYATKKSPWNIRQTQYRMRSVRLNIDPKAEQKISESLALQNNRSGRRQR